MLNKSQSYPFWYKAHILCKIEMVNNVVDEESRLTMSRKSKIKAELIADKDKRVLSHDLVLNHTCCINLIETCMIA